MRIEFETGNAAFEDRGAEEYRDIFAGIVAKLQAGWSDGKISDSNGNAIGEWSDE